MEKSSSIIALSKALFKFHSIVEKITRDGKNPAFKRGGKESKYATLSNIQDAIRQPLQEAGLIYVQVPEMDNTLVTILIHPETGEYIQGVYDIKPTTTTPQSMGSAITYARRYALGAILGLNIDDDDDDDGNEASGTGKQATKNSTVDANTLQSWKDEVNKIKTLDELTVFFNSNKDVCNSYPEIKLVFTNRKKELSA